MKPIFLENDSIIFDDGSRLEFSSNNILNKEVLVHWEYFKDSLFWGQSFINIKIWKKDFGFLIGGYQLFCKDVDVVLYNKDGFIVYSSKDNLDVCNI